MNRRIIPIGVDIEKVKTVFGCKDEALYYHLLNSDFFNEFDNEFSFKNELYSLIFNYIIPEKRIVKPAKFFGLIKADDGRGLKGDWNDYGYALLTICGYLGDKFENNGIDFVYGESWWQINTLLREQSSRFDLTRMYESKQVFDTPYRISDIYTNIYNKKEVTEFFSHLLKMEKDIKNENFGLFNSLKNGLSNCLDKKLDLVVFSFEN